MRYVPLEPAKYAENNGHINQTNADVYVYVNLKSKRHSKESEANNNVKFSNLFNFTSTLISENMEEKCVIKELYSKLIGAEQNVGSILDSLSLIHYEQSNEWVVYLDHPVPKTYSNFIGLVVCDVNEAEHSGYQSFFMKFSLNFVA